MDQIPPLFFHHEVPGRGRTRPRPAGPPLNHSLGPHQAQLSPTASTILRGDYPADLFVGLLTKLPCSDGTFLAELDAPDYARQPVSLAPRSGTHYCVPRPILFDIHRLPVIAGLGLFDAQAGGALCGYGAVYSSRLSREPVERIEIISHQLLVKRVQRNGAL